LAHRLKDMLRGKESGTLGRLLRIAMFQREEKKWECGSALVIPPLVEGLLYIPLFILAYYISKCDGKESPAAGIVYNSLPYVN
jgi:hypothetical protein